MRCEQWYPATVRTTHGAYRAQVLPRGMKKDRRVFASKLLFGGEKESSVVGVLYLIDVGVSVPKGYWTDEDLDEGVFLQGGVFERLKHNGFLSICDEFFSECEADPRAHRCIESLRIPMPSIKHSTAVLGGVPLPVAEDQMLLTQIFVGFWKRTEGNFIADE